MRRKTLLSVILCATMIIGSTAPAFAAGSLSSNDVTAESEVAMSESQEEVEAKQIVEDDSSAGMIREDSDVQETAEDEVISAEAESEETNTENAVSEEDSNDSTTVEESEREDSTDEAKTDSAVVEEEKPETLVGTEGEHVSVGENVTARFDSATGTLTFYSQGGTLSSDWKNKMDVTFSYEIYDNTIDGHEIKVITISDDSDVMYLPENCSGLFQDFFHLQSLNLSKADTSNVTDMSRLFSYCESLQTLDVTGFDTSNVTKMNRMFSNCSNLQTLDVSGFDTSNVMDMEGMFSNCSSLQMLNVNGFDTSNVSDMTLMFYNCSGLQTLDLSGFETLPNMYSADMVDGCDFETLLSPVNGWINAKLPCPYVDEYGTIYYSIPMGTSESIRLTKKRITVGEFSVGENVTAGFDSETGTLTFYSLGGTLSSNWKNNMGVTWSMEIYEDAINDHPIEKIMISDDSDVMYLPENCEDLFGKLGSLKSLDLSKADTSNVTNMSWMFDDCKSLQTLDLSGFDTSNVTDMSWMFDGCQSLQTLDLSGFDTSNVTSMSVMFQSCNSLLSLDVSSFDTSNVTMMSKMFWGCSSLQYLDVSGFDTSNVTYMSDMFRACSSLQTLDLSGFDTSQVSSMSGMFASSEGLQTLDLSGFNTSNVTSMSWVFYGCSNLQTLNLSGFDTSYVSNMRQMFANCSSLQNLDLSSFNTLRVTDMYYMFENCSNLKNLNLSGFNTSNVNNMSGLFSECSSLQTLDLSGFDTSSIWSMSSLFRNCSSLQTLDLSGFDTSRLEGMSSMFSGCSSLQNLNLSGFNTSELEYMEETFLGCSSLKTLDLSGFDLSKLKIFSSVFADCDFDIIFTPVNVQKEINLPNTYVDDSGAEYNTLPEGLSESIRLTKKGAEIPSVLEILGISEDCYGATGSMASFHIDAQGTGTISYQWQYRTSGMTDWKSPAQASAKTADYAFKLKPSYDNIEVRCIVSDESGNEIISETRKANVFAYTSQPRDAAASEGQVVNFEVSAIGRGVTYQWYYMRPNSTWRKTTISGSKTAVLPITAGTKNDGTSYRCVITDEEGNKITSAAGTLTLEIPLQITGISEDAYDVNGESVAFHIDAIGNGDLSYQWQYKLAGESEWRTPAQASAKTADYVFKLRPSYDNIEVRCIVKDASGNSATSEVRKANVFAITGQPQDADIKLGEKTTFAVEAVGRELVYQWYYMRPAGSWKKVTVAGYNTASLLITANTKNDGTMFRCLVKDVLGNTLTSKAATLTQ